MASENFPVIIRCQETTVAIPIKTLIEESTIFKTLYESVEINSSSALSESGRDSGCSLQDIQDLPCDEDKAVTANPDSNSNNSIEGSTIKEAETLESSHANKKHKKNEDNSNQQQCQSSILRTIQQFDNINLSKFNGKSVRILFNSIQGHPELIEACNSLTVLFGVLKLCDEYGISSPISQILTRFKTCDTITMANLLDAMKIAEDIEKMKNYVDISAEIIQRCVSFARWNFASWQVILKLIIQRKDQCHLLVRILEKLRDESEAIIRFKVDNFSKISEGKFSSTFIINNLGWNIEIHPSEKDEKNIGVKVQCENPNCDDGWYCDAKIGVRIVNHKTQDLTFLKDINHRFKEDDDEGVISDLTTFESVLDLSAGFIKDNQIVFEVKISVDYIKGVSESLGVTEQDMGWFDKITGDSIKQLSESQDQNVNTLEDSPVIFSCDRTLVVVHKSVLIKESSVFRTMFSKPWTRSNESRSMDDNMKLIELTGYNQLSVKYLMELLQGYPSLFNECKDISVIGDMIRISDFYDIKRPVPELLAKITNLKIDMKNVVKGFQVSEALNALVAFEDLSSNLASKCITYLRFNLAYWQVLINFLVINGSQIDLVVKMIEMLADENVGNIRFESTKMISEMENVLIPHFIHRNISWEFQFVFEEKEDKESFLEIHLFCDLQEEQDKNKTCSAGFKYKLHKKPFWEATSSWTDSEKSLYDENSNGWGELYVISKKEFLDESNGYVKNGCSCFEFEIEADEPTGISESLGVTEEMII